MRQQIFAEIESERRYQEQRWGNDFDDTHSPADWWVFVTFYFSRALGSWRVDKGNLAAFDSNKLREGLVKVAAIVVAWIEALDRRRVQ